MYKWKIELILKSGKELTVFYEGHESSSGEVVKKLLAGDENTFNGFSDKNGTKNIFVKVGEIAATAISVA